MQRRSEFRAVVVAVACVVAALFSSSVAFADGKTEAAAKQLQKKAMEDDYLATDFAKAAEKLKEAIAKCGESKCSSIVRAQLRRDLGTVLVGGQIDKQKGENAFIDALAIDSSIQLDPDLKTREIEAVWEAAKKSGGGAPAASSGASSAATKGAAPAGDFTHTPVAVALVRTPLPIFAEYGGEEKLVKVIARYKGFGMTEFKTLELRKVEGGFGALVPCADVQQGDLQYYLQGFNEANDPVATAGDRAHPYKVPVKNKIDGEVPHLPGQPAPTQCAETGDCPPDFPGCKAKKTEEPVAAPVEQAEPEPDGKDEGATCEENSECKSRECKAGACTAYEAKKAFKRNWIGVSFGFDMMGLPSSSDTCKLNQTTALSTSGYYCTRSDGTDYPSRDPNMGAENSSIVTGRTDADTVHGGSAVGVIRIALTYDFALNPSWLLGARVGYTANGYTGDAAKNEGKGFPPLMLEARGTYVYPGIDKVGPHVYGFAGFGVSRFSAGVGVSVVESNNNTLSSVSAKAWKLAGPEYIGLGVGYRHAFTSSVAAYIAPKFDVPFGSAGSSFVFSPELGIQYGF